jgi:extradiol dioxygenase family protein
MEFSFFSEFCYNCKRGHEGMSYYVSRWWFMAAKVDLQEIRWQISPIRRCKGLTVAEGTREIRRRKMSYNMYVPSANLVSI